MKKSISALLCIAAFAGMVFAQATAPVKSEIPAPEAPAVKLPPLPEVVATVGDTKILGSKIEKMISKLPATVPASIQANMRQRALSSLVLNALLENYVAKKGIKPTEADLKAVNERLETIAKQRNITAEELMKSEGITKKDLEVQAAAQKLFEDSISKEKVDALVKAHPEYFNGTEVQASHILVLCAPMSQTKDAKAAYEKIKQIRDDIAAGKIKFDEAANKFSECPSGKRKGEKDDTEYGDLGFFAFSKDGKMMMAPPFAVAAFATKVGEISGIVRTQFGFHIIKVLNRKDANNKFETAQADEVAKMVLASELQNAIFNQTLEGCDLTIDMDAFKAPEVEEPVAAPEAAPAPAPAPAPVK